MPSYFGTVSTEKDWQLNFDNNCYKNIYCHKDPPAKGHRHEGVPQGRRGPLRRPQDRGEPEDGDRPATPLLDPWTIHDISTDAPPGTYHYAPCISCHDPHGADYSGYTYCSSAPPTATTTW